MIGGLRAVLPDAVMVALTATAPPALLNKVKESLHMLPDCAVVRVSPNKSNIRLVVSVFDVLAKIIVHHVFPFLYLSTGLVCFSCYFFLWKISTNHFQ